jgi:hypothetical protein
MKTANTLDDRLTKWRAEAELIDWFKAYCEKFKREPRARAVQAAIRRIVRKIASVHER